MRAFRLCLERERGIYSYLLAIHPAGNRLHLYHHLITIVDQSIDHSVAGEEHPHPHRHYCIYCRTKLQPVNRGSVFYFYIFWMEGVGGSGTVFCNYIEGGLHERAKMNILLSLKGEGRGAANVKYGVQKVGVQSVFKVELGGQLEIEWEWVVINIIIQRKSRPVSR